MYEAWLQQILNKLSPKNLAFMGISGRPAFRDDFITGAEGVAPDTTKWSVVKDNDAIVQTVNDAVVGYPRCLKITAGTVGDNDGLVYTDDKIVWNSLGIGVTSMHIKTRVRITDLTGNMHFGVRLTAVASSELWINTSATYAANLYLDNDVMYAHTSDGTAEATNISAYFANATWAIVEIVIASGSTKFYVNGTLRATHTTHPMINVHCALGMGARNKNGITTETFYTPVEVWME